MPESTSPTSDRTRRLVTWIVLAFAVVGSMVHQAGPTFQWKGWELQEVNLRLWEWYIEDAAISFAYARNWAMGDGLVAFPGGEPIEGYSNPSWVALMALWYLVGIDGFLSSKLMAMFFGACTVILSWRIAAEIIDDDDSWAPLVAPIILAAYPNFAFWNASGLENPIFNFFLAGGVWRTVVEGKRGGYPWASAWFLGLAVSRPEGIMYGAWAGFYAMVASLRAGRGFGPTLKWLATFFVPFLAYHWVRYDYFARTFPNTYYAKLGTKDFRPFAWMARGWKYIRNWAYDSGIGWFTPVFVVGLVGLRGRRRWAAAVGILLIGIAFLYPDGEITKTWDWWPKEMWAPDAWAEARVWLLLSLALVLPVIALRDRRAGGRVLLWGMALITFLFCIRATGDWMKGYRWMSFVSVPLAVLFACGVEELAGAAQRIFGRRDAPGWSTPGWLTATVLVLAVMPGFFLHSEWFFGKRETGPFSVKRRVEYTALLMDRLWVHDRLVRNLDVDMGAHLYWSEHQMVDMAGLVDTTIAHHNYKQRAVTQEYVFDEQKPLVGHVHGGWANNSRIPTFNEWKRDYVGVPGFPVSKRTYHTGNHVRRDLILTNEWSGTQGRRVAFADGIALAGFDVPSPELSVGKSLYLEVGMQYRQLDDKQDFRVIAFLSNEQGALYTFDVPPGYDWVPPSEWRLGEVGTTRLSVNVPEALEPGLYDLGFVVLAQDGHVVPVATGGDDEDPVLPQRVVYADGDEVEARFARGEIRFPNIVRIGPAGTGERAAAEDFDRAMKLARDGRCRDAEGQWRLARLHVPRADKWWDGHREQFGPVEAACYAKLAENTEDRYAAADLLLTARVWDHRADEVWRVGRLVGDALFEVGEDARADEDWETAYRAYQASAVANPANAWARRYAEETRDYRLGIDPESEAQREAEREAAAEKAKEEREAREAQRKAEGKQDRADARARAAEAAEGDEAGGEGDEAGETDE